MNRNIFIKKNEKHENEEKKAIKVQKKNYKKRSSLLIIDNRTRISIGFLIDGGMKYEYRLLFNMNFVFLRFFGCSEIAARTLYSKDTI